MTVTERNALITSAYDYMATIADESYDEYKAGESIDKYVIRGKNLYRVIRALQRYAEIDPKSNVRFLESHIMTLANIYGQPRSALFSTPSFTEYRYRWIGDGPLGTMAYKNYWQGTQAQYDALGSYDADTLYFIVT